MLQRFNLAIGLLCLVGLASLAFYSFKNQQKLVYVDSAKLLNSYQGMINARKAYQHKAAAWQSNIDTLTQEVQQQIAKYEKELASMSAKERQLSQELIRTKQKQLIEYQQALNSQAQQEDLKMTGDVVSQVNAFPDNPL